ncbi:MAG: HD-GYP domain-containing protein [Syntrophales bacterium]|nr:HD-GYP domain-containing protein [Syntrophales bacterium]MDD5642619.1 HD-GYP domain-containing protein [Syntrophales bacterium]
MATTESEKRIKIDQLRPGIFIRLQASWFEHPFLFNSLKIKNLGQIEALKKAGITEVFYIPQKSDSLPLPLNEPQGKASPPPKPATPPQEDPVVKLLWQIKKDRMEKLKENQENLRKCTKDYNATVKDIPGIMEKIIGGSQEAVSNARTLIAKMAGKFINKGDSFVHLMAIKETEESIYYHSLNASVLALMLGAKAGFSPSEMRDLGLGVLLHDIGKSRIDNKVLKKVEPLSKAEQNLIRLHPQYGVEIVAKSNDFPKNAAMIILQHHEQCDGSGYPQHRTREKISKLARVANIVNVYDNLCNNIDPAKAMNPYQALSYMYSRCKKGLDLELLTLFIRSLGVYPPGTVVMLSNGIIALIVSVNPQNPMKPSLMLYDPDIPKNEAVAVEMEDLMDLTVEKSLRFEDLPAEVCDYFNYSGKANYFVEQVKEGDKSA